MIFQKHYSFCLIRIMIESSHKKKPSIDGFKFYIRDNSINYDCFQERRLPYLAYSIICLSTPKALAAQRMK